MKVVEGEHVLVAGAVACDRVEHPVKIEAVGAAGDIGKRTVNTGAPLASWRQSRTIVRQGINEATTRGEVSRDAAIATVTVRKIQLLPR